MALFKRLLPFVFAVTIAANLFELASLTVLHWKGETGLDLAHTGQAFEWRAARVYGAAREAGFRVGDRFDSREGYRADGDAQPLPGTPFREIAHRGDRVIDRTIVPTVAPVDWTQIIRLACAFWVLAFAWLIAARAAPTRANALLTFYLLMLALESPSSRIAWPDTRLEFASWTLGAIPIGAAVVALALYGAVLAQPMSGGRKVLQWFTYACLGVLTVWSVIINSALFLKPWMDVEIGVAGFATTLTTSIEMLLPWLCLGASLPAAHGAERRRIAWVFASFTPFLIATTLANIFNAPFWSAVQNVSYFFIPAGLTYAALARRMFDVGFVVNRTAVFGIVSTVVVGAFVLLEWSLGKWFENASHTTSLVLNIALALLLGLSIRFIHDKANAAVDNLFFRTRHENDTALRRFAREAAFFTDAETLRERIVATILSRTEVTSASVLPMHELDANDAAVVAMRTWHDPVDLTQCETALRGDYAFPMLAHGELAGVIVCGAKRTGEHFAPDEVDALQTLAHGAGLALDGLQKSANAAAGPDVASLLGLVLARLDILIESTAK